MCCSWPDLFRGLFGREARCKSGCIGKRRRHPRSGRPFRQVRSRHGKWQITTAFQSKQFGNSTTPKSGSRRCRHRPAALCEVLPRFLWTMCARSCGIPSIQKFHFLLRRNYSRNNHIVFIVFRDGTYFLNLQFYFYFLWYTHRSMRVWTRINYIGPVPISRTR